jgi:hypothetical protein
MRVVKGIDTCKFAVHSASDIFAAPTGKNANLHGRIVTRKIRERNRKRYEGIIPSMGSQSNFLYTLSP